MTYATADRSTRFARPARRVSMASLLVLWRQRRQLQALDARALDDMGLSVADVRAEARRAIWDVPANWRN